MTSEVTNQKGKQMAETRGSSEQNGSKALQKWVLGVASSIFVLWAAWVSVSVIHGQTEHNTLRLEWERKVAALPTQHMVTKLEEQLKTMQKDITDIKVIVGRLTP